MPEYLAIGTDKDFLRIPMNLYTAAAVASRMGFVLPTRKIVDAIYAQAAFHFAPEPMTAGPQMRSTQYYVTHNQKVEKQSRALGVTQGALVSGDKKDVVVSETMLVDGEAKSVYDVLDDPALAQVLSDEGPIPNLHELLTRTGNEQPCAPVKPSAFVNPLDGVPRLPL
jgi:hypothetical protein